ncbi:peptidoglycan DD-metalloendopeptidase family protein [Kingella oralis]|uniref:peptidoglycan DD-metalloendopeptidase family protein n=1 Tax=Kingella oralis TaxID=505 RepID=UPI002D80B5E7|nr:peptidoglycan DD-metalloendopeptidase family protein [Kingella oralis]
MKWIIRLGMACGAAWLLAACSSSGSAQQARCSASRGFYCVKAGDNLYRIGLRFGVSVNQLKSWNNLRGDRVVVGQKLRVSRGAAARSTATAYAPAPAPVVPPIALQMPAANGRIVREFGGGNRGVDIAGEAGAPVLAAAAGQVVYIGTEVRGYPNLILIRHNAALFTAYSNNAGVLVGNNARVEAGQQIATMSSSFQSNEGLLHFEVREHGKAVNPRDYLR